MNTNGLVYTGLPPGMVEHLDGMALEFVRVGRVAKRGQAWLYRGRPFAVTSQVAAALRRLERAGMLTLARPDEHGVALVRLTEIGRARHRSLSSPGPSLSSPGPRSRPPTLKRTTT